MLILWQTEMQQNPSLHNTCHASQLPVKLSQTQSKPSQTRSTHHHVVHVDALHDLLLQPNNGQLLSRLLHLWWTVQVNHPSRASSGSSSAFDRSLACCCCLFSFVLVRGSCRGKEGAGASWGRTARGV
jgi:hypothetical protein